MGKIRKNIIFIFILCILLTGVIGSIFASNNNIHKYDMKKDLKKIEKRDYYIIQFQKSLSKEDKDLLEIKFDFELIYQLNENFWYVSIQTQKSSCFANKKRVEMCYKEFTQNNQILFYTKTDATLKISQNIKDLQFSQNSYTKNGNVVIFVYYDENKNIDEIIDLFEKYKLNVVYTLEEIGVIALEINENDIEDLIKLKEVKYIEEVNVNYQNTIFDVKNTINANNYNNDDLYFETGEGVKILQYEIGVPYNHYSYENKLTIPQKYVTQTEHATHIAGILVSNSESSPEYQGIAKGAQLISYMPTFNPFEFYFVTRDTNNHYREAVGEHGAQLITNSWGTSSFDCKGGSYTTDSKLLDRLTIDLQVPIFWSAGNIFREISCSNDLFKSDYMNILPRASAKNVITVGAVNSNDNSIAEFSSYGPTYDGRIKPEIVAPGCVEDNTGIYSTSVDDSYSNIVDQRVACGTSFATPQVAGAGALIAQVYSDRKLLPSSYKAILVNSVRDLKNDGSGKFENDGPDFKTGFGLLNVADALDTAKQENLFESVIENREDIKYFSLDVSENQKDLKITLAWDDLPGNWYDWTNLKNDLELFVFSPSGKLYLPWSLVPSGNNYENLPQRDKRDSLNVVEQVYVYGDEIEVGKWIVLVRAEKLESEQTFSIAHNLVKELGEVSGEFDLSEGLVAYYPFDGNCRDYSGNGNDCVYNNGATLVSDCIKGQCYSFDGIDDYIDFGKAFDFSNNTELSVFAWVKADENFSKTGTILSHSDTSVYPYSQFHLFLLDNNKFHSSINYDRNYWDIIQSNTINDYENWYLIGITKDFSGNFSMYLNRELEVSIKGDPKIQKAPKEFKSWIGSHYVSRYKTEHYKEFKGLIDEVAIWNRSLSKDEVSKLYLNGI